MMTYLECWIASAQTLFPHALAGAPQLVDSQEEELPELLSVAMVAGVSGDVTGRFTVFLDPGLFDVPLLGDGRDQKSGWQEFLREVAESAAGELLRHSGKNCRIDSLGPCRQERTVSRALHMVTLGRIWRIFVHDEVRTLRREAELPRYNVEGVIEDAQVSPGLGLLMDVELEASLRFGCCEMPLGEILELGPGDVVELDRHVSDPVDLVVGDKIVARGDVVLVNGYFGLRVTEVAAPQRRLESIRCLF